MVGRPLRESLPLLPAPMGPRATFLPGMGKEGRRDGMMALGTAADPGPSWSGPRALIASVAISPPFRGAKVLGAFRTGASPPVGWASGGRPCGKIEKGRRQLFN